MHPVEGHTRLQLDQEGLSALRSISTPIVPVVVIGPYRSGKSFLLNQLLGVGCGEHCKAPPPPPPPPPPPFLIRFLQPILPLGANVTCLARVLSSQSPNAHRLYISACPLRCQERPSSHSQQAFAAGGANSGLQQVMTQCMDSHCIMGSRCGKMKMHSTRPVHR